MIRRIENRERQDWHIDGARQAPNVIPRAFSDDLSHLFRRVVMTISGVGLAVVSSILYLRVPSLVLLALGLFISFLLIALVFSLPNPQRYPFRVRRARKAGRMI